VKRARKPKAIRNESRGTWVCFPVINGKRTTRKLGNLNELTQQQADARALEKLRSLSLQSTRMSPTVLQVVQQYRVEKMPKRHSTRRSYEVWLGKHIIPRWGEQFITELRPRLVELWLESLDLAPKSRGHIRGLLHKLWSFAMWSEMIPMQENPIRHVTVKGSSTRLRQPRSLTMEEFRRFVQRLEEPFRTIALVCVCFGLRISECLALKWADVNWLERTLSVERSIVRNRVDDVKTIYSARKMTIGEEMLKTLKTWRQTTEFSADGDWVFSSPDQIGRFPWSYDTVRHHVQDAGTGIERLGTHSMRHTYRSWLDAVGATISVQREMMRHSDIRTTMNVYGSIVTDEVLTAHRKVVSMALSDSKVIPPLASH
jgi:integrase